jgi:hypothetical protein
MTAITNTQRNQEFDFENNMTESEARAKHDHLKSLLNTTRTLLLEMRDRKGYLALGFATFEEYGEKEFGYSPSYIYRLAKAEEIQLSLNSPNGELSESQLRPLGKVPTVDRDAVYQQAKDHAEQQGKELTAKMVSEAVADYLEKLNNAQLTIERLEKINTDKNMALTKLVEEVNDLETSIDQKAEALAAKKVAEKQAEMQKQLNERIAEVEAENQTAVSDLKLTISRLTQEKNALLSSSSLDTDKLERDERHLEELQEEINEAKASLKKLSIEQDQADAAKKYNHAVTGIVTAIGNDINDHFDSLNGLQCGDGDGEANHILPLYPLTDNTKFYLLEIARVLRNSASAIDFLLNYEEQKTVDEIDVAYEKLADFFAKYKEVRQTKNILANDFGWWFSALRLEPIYRKEKGLFELFAKVWERYEHEIRATDVEVA